MEENTPLKKYFDQAAKTLAESDNPGDQAVSDAYNATKNDPSNVTSQKNALDKALKERGIKRKR